MAANRIKGITIEIGGDTTKLQTALKLINKKGLKNSEVYATANISKQYFSKLLKGQVSKIGDATLPTYLICRL